MGRNYVALTLADDRDHAKAKEVSAILQRLLEAEHRCHEDPHEPAKAPDERKKLGLEKRTRTKGRTK